MKSLQLTRDQKKRLLEMTRKLFPEYKKVNLFNTMVGDGLELTPIKKVDSGFKCAVTHKKIYYPNYQHIHWFEFCMTYLAEKILNPKDENTSLIKKNFSNFFCDVNSYSWFIQDPGIRESFALHPVDYLYKEFKKLK